jgi:hypoxanthine phosphoribosyltransferase
LKPGKVLIESNEIRRRVCELGEEISENYRDVKPVLVTILKGGVIFASDLIREMSIPVELDFLSVSSYDKSKKSGQAKIVRDLAGDVHGKHVLLVENIVDSGSTLDRILKEMKARGAASVEVCCLLDKRVKRKHDVDIRYKGFIIDDKFVVGYGLDYNQNFRNLPDIMLLEK